MLRELRIQNLILISSATIHFDKGLNVLSGETGSGKSAIMKALYLLAGEKGDTSVVRHGADKAIIEGFFDITQVPGLATLLEQYNIDHEDGDDLIIRRELSLSGKGRCTINNQSVQVSLLKKVGALLLEMVGQHANQKLLSIENHRRLLDLYGSLNTLSTQFAKSWEEENSLASRIDTLINNESQRIREMEVCRIELEELYDARLKEGEEEELFAEYSRLSNADEITSKVHEISQTLNGERLSILSIMKRQSQIFDQLTELDPAFAEPATSHKNALLELEEISYTIEKLGGRVESNPERLDAINNRLTLINKLKKKYGGTILSLQEYAARTEEKLKSLESADMQIEEGKAALSILKETNQQLAAELTTKRKAAAKDLEKRVVEQLLALNMPKVQFEIDIATQPRSSHGDEQVEFFLIPNVGERRIPIREHASGGELSRVLLALQTLLAGKESVATLVFDEIDANIGGATAVVIGEKLHEIGKRHQVLCITHFPQVAKQADHHIQIEKKEHEGRTVSQINRLDIEGRQRELDRMQGVVRDL